MVVIEELVSAGADDGVEDAHAEEVDVLGLLRSIEELPVPSEVEVGALHDFLGLIDECLACHI